MIRFALALRPAAGRVRDAVAWFVDGNDPVAWIEEIGRWGVPMGELRIFLVPRSVRDRRVAGVLVTAPSGVKPAQRRRAHGYACLAGRLFLPADAVLCPEVSDAELSGLLNQEVHVLHPLLGLSGYEAADGVRVADLLSPPPMQRCAWDRALPGAAACVRLRGVNVEESPDGETILADGRDDIGRESTEDLDPAAGGGGEGASFAERTRARLQRGLLRWARRHGASNPQAGASTGFAGAVAGAFTIFSRALERARCDAVERLLRSLQVDPDTALRFALPLGDRGSRGMARPSAELTTRDVDLHLDRLRGGRPADSWHVPDEILARLRAGYRRAADRELQLGRFRRAAYVFAELLGDYAAAVDALCRGRFFREGAVLCREHLRDSVGAAKCLEEGGLLLEAAGLYEKDLRRFEKAGDLYRTIRREDEAVRCYRLAFDGYVARSEHVAAARLLEAKLGDAQKALSYLDERWAAPEFVRACLQELFAILARHERYDEIRQRIEALRTRVPPNVPPVAVVAALAASAEVWRRPNVRAVAADAVRVIAGRALAGACSADARELVRAVTGLDQSDPVLVRDGVRWLAAAAARRPVRLEARPVVRRGERKSIEMLELGDDYAWVAAASEDDRFYAYGVRAGEAVFVQCHWSRYVRKSKVLLASVPRAVVLQPLGGRLLVAPIGVGLHFGRAGKFEGGEDVARTVVIEQPDWLTGLVGGFAVGAGGMAWAILYSRQMGLVMHGRSLASGSIVTTIDLGEVGGVLPFPMGAAPSGDVIAGLGDRLFHVRRNGARVWHELPRPPSELTVPPCVFTTRVLAAGGTDEGSLVLFDDDVIAVCAHDMAQPHALFTRDESLVVVNPEEGRVYRPAERYTRFSTFNGPGEAIAAVIRAPGGFAIVTGSGKVHVY